jgi:hypothetical protein
MTQPTPKAFDRFDRILTFVGRAALDGRLSPEDEAAVGEAGGRVFRDAGVVSRLDADDPVHRAVARHAAEVMRTVLLELRPALGPDLAAALGERGSRRG